MRSYQVWHRSEKVSLHAGYGLRCGDVCQLNRGSRQAVPLCMLVLNKSQGWIRFKMLHGWVSRDGRFPTHFMLFTNPQKGNRRVFRPSLSSKGFSSDWQRVWETNRACFLFKPLSCSPLSSIPQVPGRIPTKSVPPSILQGSALFNRSNRWMPYSDCGFKT